MAVGTDYSTPVYVNGYTCKNCTEVDNAKKHIDPAHPKAGPYGINAKNDPSLQNKPAVTFDGTLSALNEPDRSTSSRSMIQMTLSRAGEQMDLSV